MSDFDECLDDPEQRCTQFCHNYIGGYYCSCRHGYHLDVDKQTCTGTNKVAVINRYSEWDKWTEGTWLKDEVKIGRIEEAEASKHGEGREGKGESEGEGRLCKSRLNRIEVGDDMNLLLWMQWVVPRICQGRAAVTSPVPSGRLPMQRTSTVSTPWRWRTTCSWSYTSPKSSTWNKVLTANA